MINLYQGDCLNVLPELIANGVTIDAIIVDPPYGTTSCSWDTIIPFDIMWDFIRKIRKDGCPTVIFGTEPYSSYLRISNIKEFKYDWVWKKSKSGSAFTAKYRPVCKHEMISVFGKGVITYYPQMVEGTPYFRKHRIIKSINNHNIGFNNKEVHTENEGVRYPITVQEFQQKWRRQDQIHPTQKPISLMEYLIKTYSKEGDTVLDFCMGSGTTGVACARLGRSFIGIEINEEYFKIAKERIEKPQERGLF